MSATFNAGAKSAYWEPNVGSFVSSVAPGAFAVTGDPDLSLTTLLGSCVAACICDPQARIGGLNHFLLPHGGERDAAQMSLRYGVHAMEVLIDELQRRGAERSRLEAKLFGGANVIAQWQGEAVGERNARFAVDFLEKERIPLRAADVGGTRARRIYFKPARNKVLVQSPSGVDVAAVHGQEETFRHRLQAAAKSGGVELF